MDVEQFDHLVEKVNQKLQNANINVAVQRINHRLYLRATFPPKPKSEKTSPHQQRLSIAQANPDGLKIAEAKAKEISGALDLNTFEWSPYLKDVMEKVPTIGELVESFERDYFSTRQRTGETLTTWKEDYQKPFARLSGEMPITESHLREIILATRPDTRQRRRFVLAYAKLADFAEIDHNLRKFIGNYSSVNSLNPRELPDDQLIAETYQLFNDPSWRWVYAVMACYGIRNHEAFFLDLIDYPIAYVSRGKTKERYVWPLYPEWPDLWGVKEGFPPNCTGRCHADFGSRVTVAFNRASTPFSPINLRHAWAIRSLEFGLDISLAASQMGHSVSVHTKIYHKWITKATHQKAMTLLLNRSDRPLPPNF